MALSAESNLTKNIHHKRAVQAQLSSTDQVVSVFVAVVHFVSFLKYMLISFIYLCLHSPVSPYFAKTQPRVQHIVRFAQKDFCKAAHLKVSVRICQNSAIVILVLNRTVHLSPYCKCVPLIN